MNAAATLCTMATDALARGAWSDAERLAREAMRAQPGHPEARRLLALALHHLGQGEAAAAMLRALIAKAPRSAQLHMNLGSVLAALGETEQALAALRMACEIEPSRAAAWFNLGKTLKAQAFESEALAALLRAAELRPQHAPTQAVLGDLHKVLGDVDAAAAAFRRSLALRPDAGHAWWGLANLKVAALTSSEVMQLQREHARTDLAAEDRILMGFALATALEQQQDFAGAFEVLRDANARQRARLPWDRAAFSAQVDQLLVQALPEVETQAEQRGAQVIFIVGLPRAGTTLVEQILAAHPDVTAASELPDLPAVIEAEEQRRGMRYADWLPLATPADWRRLGEEYLSRTRRWQVAGRRFTDKWPNNFIYVDAISRMLPGARAVGCERAAMDTCWSCLQQYFVRGQAFSYDLDDLVAYQRDFLRLHRHWQSTRPERYLGWHHEALLADPQARIRELLQFAGLTDDAACLTPHLARRPIRSASAAQVLEPIHGGRRERWRPHAERLQPWLAALAEPL
jgi:tetratricopeptide (TPR) repeat protein